MRNYVTFIIFLSFSIVTNVSAQDYMYDSGLPNTAHDSVATLNDWPSIMTTWYGTTVKKP